MKILIIGMLFIMGCSSQPKNYYENGRRDLNEYVEVSETQNYFLSDIPEWANFNTSAQCRRTTRVKYLNLDKISQSFGLDYQKTLQFQILYNNEYQKLKSETGISVLPYKNEHELFYLITNKIQAGFVPLKIPDYERINLIWVDRSLNDPNKLKRLLNGPEMEKGPPILVSLCLSGSELRKFQSKMEYKDVHLSLIPMEAFSVFGPENDKMEYFNIDLSKLFNKNQRLYIYLPKGSNVPEEFRGEYIVKFF